MANKVKTKEPLIKIQKRDELKVGKKIGYYLLAICSALIFGGLVIAISGKNPFLFYGKMIIGNFENPIKVSLLIRTIVPLLITALGVSLAFKMKFWNIGAEGQFLVGALGTCTIALLIGDKFPPFISIITGLVFGSICGALYGLIPALCKSYFRTNETLLTLMMNYIALYFVGYLINVPFFGTAGMGFPQYKKIDNNFWLSKFKIAGIDMDISFFIGIAIVIVIFICFKFTKQGYEISVVGDSPNTAKYAGMNVKKITFRTIFFSAFIIGLAGALQITGISSNNTLSPSLTGGVGWTAIIVAWLAKLNPIGIFVTSSLIGILERGCTIARSEYQISSAMSDILMGVILFSILAIDFFIRYKVVINKKKNIALINNITKSDEPKLVDITHIDNN